MAALAVWILFMSTVFTESEAQDCGVAPLNTKIVGGVDASASSWPWQVSVHYNGAHICGGTLISDQWVLTAAHCIITPTLDLWTLYFGIETLSGPNPNQVTRTVSQTIVNSNFNNTLFNNDIALMQLSSPITFNNYIRPICLASNSSQFYNSTPCWVTGWGRLGDTQPLVAYNILQEVEIPVVGPKECSCDYQDTQVGNITDQMICAGQQNKGTCQGDSGGPLQCKQGSVWIQAGITSFEVPCALAGFPGVFARVSEFESWITNQVSGANVGFVTFTSSGTNQDDSFVCSSTNTVTATTSQNMTSASTQSQTSTSTQSQTSTSTQSQTSTSTQSQTSTSTQSQTSTSTQSQTSTPTQSQTSTSTQSQTSTSTQSQTSTSTQSQTSTSTQSQTSTSTQSQTSTPTQSQTSTSTQSQTSTSTQSQTSTPTQSLASIQSQTSASTQSQTLTSTQSQTLTSTQSQTSASTQSQTLASTQSQTSASTQSQTLTSTQSQTLTSTQSQILTSTQSQTSASTQKQTSTTNSATAPELSFTLILAIYGFFAQN